jgi:hypothetical protein
MKKLTNLVMNIEYSLVVEHYDPLEQQALHYQEEYQRMVTQIG